MRVVQEGETRRSVLPSSLDIPVRGNKERLRREKREKDSGRERTRRNREERELRARGRRRSTERKTNGEGLKRNEKIR